MDALSGGVSRARPEADGERLELTRPARPEYVAGLRAAAREFAQRYGVANDGDVALAISEAVTNAVVHAYAAESPGLVRVTAMRADGEVTFTIEDEGRGPHGERESPGPGLGLGVMAQLARHFAISARPGGGTTVQLTFPADRGNDY
jgi:serine/threonine-protein kinase RsbW